MTGDVGLTLLASLNNAIIAVVGFVPKFIAGAVILLIGIIVASLLKQIIVGIFKALKFESLLKKYGVPEAKEEFTWTNILAEVGKWFVIIVFLLPAADIWGLSRLVTVLNEFLLYLPNVFVAAIIALVGFVFAKLGHNVILASTKGVSPDVSHAIASIARYAIVVFVILAVFSQLGVATDLVKILFSGFVAMIAIAGGIAFGLGGQGAAKDMLEEIRRRLK